MSDRTMKTGRMIGLLVLAGIAIGAVLSAVLPDFGFGLGSGGGIGNPPGLKPAANAPPAESPSTGPIEGATSATEEAAPPDVVYILIDGRNYLLRHGAADEASFQPASLDQVVQAAQAATGDDNGIRVRIAQKSSARETTERALRAKLDEAGIPGDAIRWKDEPVEGSAP